MDELKPRIRDGKESDTHFLYTAKDGHEWSVVNFKKMMQKSLDEWDNYDRMFSYSWEGMCFDEPHPEDNQFRGGTAEEVLTQIEASNSNERTTPKTL